MVDDTFSTIGLNDPDKIAKGLVGLARDLLSGVIILMLTITYLLGSFGLLVIFALLDILHIKKLT